ncbi:MAG: S9 family peptidase [Bacteroidia bacterium]|nr:S9 family peptidase [Bacteroidia bacterium]NNF32184.1 S9 family peptidase [Flavobacteriaceae bacterium]MBT8276647.1 S9 family peptidase [Bacteroidia bacterium]NNJ82883.1 S9 family peptidase [Flavobacteriaceae bacterium]NNK55105.1 S9 family peptidase [Flavobacteriaceae bacterium]
MLLLFLAVGISVQAQQKQITLEEIWGGAFRTQRLDVLRSLENGKEYAVLDYNRAQGASTVDVYDYASGEKVRTLINSSELEDINYIISYEFNKDETKMLLATQLKQIYRRSSIGTYYVYDINTKKLTLVSEKQIQEPTFSPDGNKIAFGNNNNLYIKDLTTGIESQITSDGIKNSIINGITDWVYEEEFGFVRAFDWSKDGRRIAYIRFDETNVPRFSMDVYGDELYPSQQVFKYPKAGDPNAEVSLHVYDLNSSSTSEVDLSAFNNYYIPRINWTNDPEILSVRVTNRHQNEVDLVFVNAKDNSSRLVLKEIDDAYVDITDDLTFLNDNSFIWTSEKSGWNHIYHYDRSGKLINQVTDGDWEVSNFYGFDPATGRIYYQSSEDGSINRGVYSVSQTGKNKVKLSQRTGSNSASFSADYSYFINTFSDTQTPYIFTLHQAKNGEQVREIKNNNELRDKVAGYAVSPKEFSTISVNGEELNMYMIKPKDFDANKKYPLFMYQYSGPGSQNVANRWGGANDYWHQMLAQQGYIIACVDGRGTGLKGRDFKKMTQKELGKFEVEDQVAAAEKLGVLPYIDENRIGIWGWSYGGFMSSNCLFQAPETFSMAIAVAPVTSWRFYDTIYTERYMQTPQENPEGYDNNSPITHVDGLKGDFLLVHGSADDNVHVQNTMRLVEALVQADKNFEWMVYPDKNHGIYGGNTRLHLYKKMTRFIQESLGKTESESLVQIKN